MSAPASRCSACRASRAWHRSRSPCRECLLGDLACVLPPRHASTRAFACRQCRAHALACCVRPSWALLAEPCAGVLPRPCRALLGLIRTNAELEEQERPLKDVCLNRVFLGNRGTGQSRAHTCACVRVCVGMCSAALRCSTAVDCSPLHAVPCARRSDGEFMP
jgi:hypothetical protein